MGDQASENDASSHLPVSSLLRHFESISTPSHPTKQAAKAQSSIAENATPSGQRHSISVPTPVANKNTSNVPVDIKVGSGQSHLLSAESAARQKEHDQPNTEENAENSGASVRPPIASAKFSPTPRGLASPRPSSRASRSPSRVRALDATGSEDRTQRKITERGADHARHETSTHKDIVPAISMLKLAPPSVQPRNEPGDLVAARINTIPGASSTAVPVQAGPPPVNRAAKPEIKVAGSLHLMQPRKNDTSGNDKKGRSPFSTPPDSDDEEPQKFQSLQPRPSDLKISDATPAVRRSSGKPPPVVRPRLHGKVEAHKPEVAERSRETVSRPLKVANVVSDNASPVQYRADAPQRPKAENTMDFPPPPKRMPANVRHAKPTPGVRASTSPAERPVLGSERAVPGEQPLVTVSAPEHSLPNISDFNRRPPYCMHGAKNVRLGHESRFLDLAGPLLATVGQSARFWDITSGRLLFEVFPADKEAKYTAVKFLPSRTKSVDHSQCWLGTNRGDLEEIDVKQQDVIATRPGIHDRRSLVKILCAHAMVWTIDDGGTLLQWNMASQNAAVLHGECSSTKLMPGSTSSIIAQDCLWLCCAKNIYIYRIEGRCPAQARLLGDQSQSQYGAITCAAHIPSQAGVVYFGHSDGKISYYSTETLELLGFTNVHVYRIYSLVGAGHYLWAGFGTGELCVLETESKPWTMKKLWMAHDGNPILGLAKDPFPNANACRLVSSGGDGAAKVWDATLIDDEIANDLEQHDVTFSSFREIDLAVLSWNAGAMTPSHLRSGSDDASFFQDFVARTGRPELVLFSFQELVDLEDKKLTAKSLFKGSMRKDAPVQEQISHQYRAWRDYLQRCVEARDSDTGYSLLHVSSLVGLFMCVFVRSDEQSHIRGLASGDIKRGMGGLHGNKGALAFRFIVDSTPVCLVNCHLAAGQTQTSSRNNDLSAILNASLFTPDAGAFENCSGGDGSRVLDHGICILSGDLNYRIDTMGRDAVIRAIRSGHFPKLLERDQLLVSRRRNPMLLIRALNEAPITFAPTYKYDFGTDRYDTSEKQRSPAWCDRILYRGSGRVKMFSYGRGELRLSDHRPVMGSFRLRIQKVSPKARAEATARAAERQASLALDLTNFSRITYLQSVQGLSEDEARRRAMA